MKTLLRKILKCSPGSISWEFGVQDFNTIGGRLKYLFYLCVFDARDWFSRLRWRLANRLAFWAAKLRHQKNYDLGYGIEGNLAAMLEDSIRWRLVMLRMGADGFERDQIDDEIVNLELLAKLAKAQHFMDWQKLEKESQ